MEKSNQKRLEEYLVGEKGYLKSDISNGKVIMLSGKWGSGKTHFWKNIIATEIFEKELKEKRKSYAYISLYGKNTIESIQNDLLYNSYEFIANPNEKVSKFFSVFTYYSQYSPEKISSGILKGITDLKNKFEFKKAESYLSDGGIICFDDFERKSKDIDLNDLFGFITQLTLNFNCKVVIILNDDVFEGEEKKIFSNVKEKSVSKFLKYEPSIKELFETIFKDDRYRKLDDHKEIILKTIQETEELNARIYIQVLDNLVEWIEKQQEKDKNILRCLILVNIVFINFHKIVLFEQYKIYSPVIDLNSSTRKYSVGERFKLSGTSEKFANLCKSYIKNDLTYSKEYPLLEEMKDIIHNENEKELINIYYLELKVLYFAYSLDIKKNVTDKTFQKINDFIESGILINE